MSKKRLPLKALALLAALMGLTSVLFQNCGPLGLSKKDPSSQSNATAIEEVPCTEPLRPIVCPSNGITFAPRNSNFLSLVGNELQIAIAYQADLYEISKLYRQARVRNVRVALDWRFIESTQGTFNWNYPDQRVGMFPPHGINPVGIINNIPRWASPNCSEDVGLCPVEDLASFRGFVRAAVQRYGPPGLGVIHDWEIRVEALPNRGLLTKEQYVTELNAALAEIKSIDPTARVWGPEVAFTSAAVDEAANATAYEWIDYAIANGNFDVFSIHHLGDITPEASYAHTKNVRDRLNAAGLSSVPLAITATALKNPAGTQEQQSQNVQDLFACISAGGADYAFWFAGTEWAPNVPDILDDVTYGILDYDFSLASKVKPKQAYYGLAELGCHIK